MKIQHKTLLLFLVSTLLLVGVFSVGNAEFLPGQNYLVLEKEIYAPYEIIAGYMNISLISEEADSIIHTKLGNQNISVLDFLIVSGLTAGKDFSCEPENCEPVYETIGSSLLSKNLEAGTFLVGSMIIGKDIELQSDSLEFSITGSDSGEYCDSSPLEVDILADGTTDWRYTKTTGEFCSSLLPSNCYDDDAASKSFDITQDGYCEKISLPVAGRFKLAALIKENKGGGDLTMFIYDKEKDNKVECDLDEPTTKSWIERSCVVNFSVLDNASQQDYYICIVDELEKNAYSIKGEVNSPVCGYSGLPSDNNASADFGLFVQPTSIMGFDKTVRIDESEFSKGHVISIQEYISAYVKDKYDNDCLTGCIVPIEIKSRAGVTVRDFSLSYCFGQGLCETENSFFYLKKQSALIDMKFTKLDLEKTNFSVPSYGEYTLDIRLGDELIGSKKISVAKVPIIKAVVAISPKAAVPIQISVDAYSPKNNSLVKYEWNFGDGISKTTTVKDVMHTYSEVGWFDVEIKVTDSEGLVGSRTVIIQIGSPRIVLNTTLAKKKALLQGISAEIEGMSWYKGLAAKKLNLYELQTELDKYEEQFKAASSDNEYVGIMNNVREIVVPKRIYDAELIQESPLIVDVDDIRPEYLEQAGAGTYKPEYAAETRNAVWNWQWENLDVKTGGRVVAVSNDDGTVDDLVTILTIKLKSKKEMSLREVFVILLVDYSKISFASDYGQQNIIDSAGFVFNDVSEEKILIALPGKVDIYDLVFFTSPSLYDLYITPESIECNNNNRCEPDIGENWKNCREDCKPIGLALVYFILIIVVMFAIYLFLQKWYKKNYEQYLFKNPQDLRNLISFTLNSLKKGLGEKEIRTKLKKAGWGSEQIKYVLKKIKGKSTGLPKISIKKTDRGVKKQINSRK